MSTSRDISYAGWQARKGRSMARLAQLEAALPAFQRERLRPASEAEALRRAGTPENLIGPVGSDDEVARERADLIDFARRLRGAAAAERD